MATQLLKRVEAFVVPGGLKGDLSELPLPDILQHVRLSKGTGVLTVLHGGAKKSLYVKSGRVVLPRATCPTIASASCCCARARSPSRGTKPPFRRSRRASAKARA